jgi:hypothetical protein
MQMPARGTMSNGRAVQVPNHMGIHGLLYRLADVWRDWHSDSGRTGSERARIWDTHLHARSYRGVVSSNLAADSPARLILEIDIGKSLPVVIAHDKAMRPILRQSKAAGNRGRASNVPNSSYGESCSVRNLKKSSWNQKLFPGTRITLHRCWEPRR